MYVAKRNDGTFETLVNGLPYHVVEDDPLFVELSEQYPDLLPGFALVGENAVQDNRGNTGWVYGELFTMVDFGPLPEGFSEIPPSSEIAAQSRKKRNRLLAETDYLMAPDYPLDADTRVQVAAYRQALRDVTMQAGFPHAVIWPEMPQF